MHIKEIDKNIDCTRSLDWLSLNEETQEMLIKTVKSYKAEKMSYDVFCEKIHEALGVVTSTHYSSSVMQAMKEIISHTVYTDEPNVINEIVKYIKKAETIQRAAEQVIEQRKMKVNNEITKA